jgi:hypothetical protein
MIPAHLLDLERSITFKPVKMGLDGGGEGVSPSFAARNQRRTHALFSDTHRSLRTSLIAAYTLISNIVRPHTITTNERDYHLACRLEYHHARGWPDTPYPTSMCGYHNYSLSLQRPEHREEAVQESRLLSAALLCSSSYNRLQPLDLQYSCILRVTVFKGTCQQFKRNAVIPANLID